MEQKILDAYRAALEKTLDGSMYKKEILDAVLADAAELQLAANTVSIIFLDHTLAHTLTQYAEFLYELVREFNESG